ncbi:Signal recognition particle subunit SRP72, partial [Oleoguttula sp. CCFEE 5521]
MASTLTSLLSKSTIEYHAEILSAAQKSITQSKGGTSDVTTQRTALVALLKLDRFAEAVAFVDTYPKLKAEANLEYAYALYKAGRPAEAAEVAAKGEDGGRGLRHVEAQSRYRAEEFVKARELYAELSGEREEDAEADLRVNSGATEVQLQFSGATSKKRKVEREDLEAFETAYNAACGCIARNELGQAEMLLKRAEALAGELSESEREAEIGPIRAQRVYVLLRLGKKEEAEALAKEVKVEGLEDETSIYVARVNGMLAGRQGEGNAFLEERLLGQGTGEDGTDNPFGFQKDVLDENQFALDLGMMKFGGLKTATQAVLGKQNAPTLDRKINSLAVIDAAAHAKSRSGKEALKHILPLLEKRPHDVGLLLTIVQLYVLTGNAPSAINLVEKFTDRLEQSGSSGDDVRFSPGLVGVTTALYNSQNRRDPARAAFARAAEYWRTKGSQQPAGVTDLLKAAGSSLLDSEEPEHQELAQAIFADLRKADSTDHYATAGLLASGSTDADKSSLTPLPRLLTSIDASVLESAGIASLPRPAPQSTKRPAPTAAPA